jgi:vancomycin resistance protein YoaR
MKISDSDIDNLNVDTDKITIKPNIKTEIASFTSTIYDKDENRVYNITLAISKLNNTIIPKGSEFSFNNTIGPMGESEGYKEAVGFDSDGDKIKIFGGGMCQISSTLYNAALIANLEITERHAHSRRVYYVPKDKDSTILYGSLDLKFINNTDGNIQILASNDKANVTIKLIKIT